MASSGKIKVIKGVERLTCKDRKLKRAFDTYFRLKNFEESGRITANNYIAAAGFLDICTKTFCARIQLLKTYGLIRYEKKQFTLISYQAAAKLFEIENVDFYYTKHTNIQHFLDAKALLNAQNLQRAAFFRKLEKHTETKEYLVSLTGLQINHPDFAAAVLNSQIQEHSVSQEESDQNDNFDLFLCRADFNLNYVSISNLFDYKGYGSAAYKKRLLQRAGLIEYCSRQVVINPHRYRSKLGNISYRRPKKQRVLQLADAVREPAPRPRLEKI